MAKELDIETKEKLAELTVQLAGARNDEAKAKDRRIQAEEAIVALLDLEEKGTLTVDPGNGLKVTVKTELGYKAEVEEIEKIDSDLIKVTIKKELDPKAYEELRQKDAALFARVSEFVTVTPKKPAVTLKVG